MDPRFMGWNPAKSDGFLVVKKSAAHFPLEGK
jgi:hypothetical protein